MQGIAEADAQALSLIVKAIGADKVDNSDDIREYYANDIFWQPGIEPLAVISPSTQREAAEAVRVAIENGIAIVPRGGGMSYTKGYLPDRARSLVIDTRNLNRIVEINAKDGYVTVEAGATWAALKDALASSGMRSGYWGPLSGVNATIGGALSQNSAFFGSSRYGTVAESVLGVTVVLADGSIATTGSGGRKGARPFTRYGGPDMTGIFLGDNGALGLKLSATLAIRPKPPETGFLSLGFEKFTDMAATQVEMARSGLVTEGFGIDRDKALQSASVNRLSDNVDALKKVVGQGKSLLSGLKDAAKIATSGLDWLTGHNYSLHIVTEAETAEALCTNLAVLAEIGERRGAILPDSIPRVMRSKPFSPVRGMLGKNGERWVPIHAVFPLSEAERVVEANEAFFAERAGWLKEKGILYTVMTMTVGQSFFIEPAFYWLDELTPLHIRSVGDAIKPDWKRRPANEDSRNAVVELRRATQEFYVSLGGASWQVARDYPYREVLDDGTRGLLDALKRAVDPEGLMNPGSLGLAATFQ
ncbi:FAD-binding oxidoreductase [Paracoccus sp. SCSIO 75233]|uniref:FAD-binding oxidoreductase n=1 Tax=Paracoccus sp. SCSIO 75233 TaxID=3017782 RepID=UPI0022F030BB|nr:FAD-binding oxidoreductase [Paracoccus sp. SCSIO 75233]WBU52986.1 FAD-binding oxidoreductase [Paracoccus sp. SCSIO 75233]